MRHDNPPTQVWRCFMSIMQRQIWNDFADLADLADFADLADLADLAYLAASMVPLKVLSKKSLISCEW